MSIEQAAQAAVSVFPNTSVTTPYGTYSLRVVMVAIAGAESGWDPTANGDCGLGGGVLWFVRGRRGSGHLMGALANS